MKPVSVLFVDDEEDIRFSFVDRFEDQFDVHTASHGREALEVLHEHPEVGVVVTDLRMPVMSGLDLIRRTREFAREVGFIVVSGHADAEDVIQALRLGARNFLRKPYSFEELEDSILTEARHYRAFIEERRRRERESEIDQFIRSIDQATYVIPNDLSWVNPVAFRLVREMVSIGVTSEDGKLNVALGLIEMITNAIEHGNLGISGEEKVALKSAGDRAYLEEIRQRAGRPPHHDRRVTVTATLHHDRATFTIEDEGAGFDTSHLPDPTDPTNLFAPSGRGILLTRTFLDDLRYNERGNAVTLVKYREPHGP